jgi:itaconyl-CoA hydratase
VSLTGPGTFYSDYRVGDLLRHCRGKTLTAFDGAGLAQLVLNTSDGHFNDHGMRDSEAGQSVVFGAITLAIVVGLAMQDTGENAICELGLEQVRFRAPAVHGDTLYAYSRVVSKHVGVVTFDHWGVNQRDQVVLELRRRVRIATGADGG